MLKFKRFIRKSHRFLAIPMAILMILKIIFTKSGYDSYIQVIISIVMIYLLISGLIMYFQSRPKKGTKNNLIPENK